MCLTLTVFDLAWDCAVFFLQSLDVFGLRIDRDAVLLLGGVVHAKHIVTCHNIIVIHNVIPTTHPSTHPPTHPPTHPGPRTLRMLQSAATASLQVAVQKLQRAVEGHVRCT